MNEPALDPRVADPELLHALAGEYIDRHRGVENYIVPFSIEFWLLCQLGLEPLSWPGRLAGGGSTSS